MTEKERYATIGKWVEVFREEGVDVSDVTIRKRLKEAGVVGETARYRMNRVIRDGFYAESDVRKLCSDLLQDLLQADEDGFFEQDGETYGTVSSLTRLIGIASKSIKARIGKSSLQSIQGRDKKGHVCDFYPVAEVRKLCADLNQDLPQADEKGFFEQDGDTYGRMGSLVELLGISERTIGSRIQDNNTKKLRGKMQNGRVCNFYLLSDVRNLCADLLRDLPQADENGFIKIDGEAFGTVASLARLIGIYSTTIHSRLQKNPRKSIRGKDQVGHVLDFYSLSEVRSLCADLLQDLPQADDKGFIAQDSDTYGTSFGLSRLLEISAPTIRSRIRKSRLKPIQGKSKMGSVLDFYPLPEVRKLCADLLGLPQADESGFFEQDGETYGSIPSLSRLWGLSEFAVRSRIRRTLQKPIQGKGKSGNVNDFYPESIVRELCADLIAKKSKK